MATGSSLLALAMTAAVGTGPADEPISCQVRLLTMDGLGWRSDYYPRLQPVARQGTSSVWTADRALAETLTGKALSAAVAPVCSNPGQTTFDTKATTCYVSHLERLADGPKNQATAIAFMPETASVEERFRACVSGRKLDQGILARVAIEEAHIKAMHVVKMSEKYVQAECKPEPKPQSVGEVIDQFFVAVEEKAVGKSEPRVDLQVQVPELSHARVEGEWLIPRDGVLLVSLGVDTVADDQGKAVVRERVAVVEVAPASNAPPMTATNVEGLRPIAAPSPMARVAMPPLPARSIPDSVDARGRAVDLTPVPEAVASADLDRIKPDQPTPQAIHAASPFRTGDPEIARVGLELEMAPRMPTLPARSLPLAYNSKGKVVVIDQLPPLPEALASADLNRIPPEPGQPSAQAPHVVSEPTRDDQLARTRFEPLEPAEPRCAVGTTTAPPTTVPGLVAQLIRKLSEMDAEVESEECTMPGCKTCGALASPKAPSSVTFGVRMQDASGAKVLDSTSRLDSALKTPGKTETQYLPVGGKFALEIKATLVPAAPGMYNEIKKNDAPAANP